MVSTTVRARPLAVRMRAFLAVMAMAALAVVMGALPASASSTWTATTSGVFGLGDSIFMQCGDTLGVGSRSLGMVGWPSATTDDLRARLSSTVPVWPWMTEPSHQAELDGFRTAGTLVIGLGTNDTWRLTPARYQANVEWFLQQAGGRPVVWFNIHHAQFPTQAAALNAILAHEAQLWPNLHIIDWAGYTAAHPEVLARDGIHLASWAACRASRLALINAAVPPVAGQTPQPDWSDPTPPAVPSPNPISTVYSATMGQRTGAMDCGHRYGGCVQTFDHGIVTWSPLTGVHTLFPSAAATWVSFGDVGGPGYPTGDASCTRPRGGCVQSFQTGLMFWSPHTLAALVTGPLLTDYLAAGGPNGVLGYPTGGEPCGMPGIGCLQEFQHGSVYWSPGTGAHLLTGAVRTRWLAAGGFRSALGYPTIDTTCVAGGCGQQFTGGSVYWTPGGGAHIVAGIIRTRWIAMGATRSALGYPVGEQVNVSGGVAQRFEHGALVYRSGAWSIIR